MFIDDLAEYLQTEGFGTVGETIFLWFAPAVSTTSITITTYQGGVPDAKFNLDPVRFQLRIRGTDTAAVTAKAGALFGALHSLAGIALSEHYLIDCQALQSEPTYFGRDASGRDDFVLNFEATVKRPSAGNRQ